MDEGLSRAVVKVFVQLHKQGLIYKDRRLVNWDPKLLTAISDLEVLDVEVKGQLWYFRYPLEGSDRFVTVATTRPETMLGDTGIAVHPDDERYRDLVGQHAILPLVGRRIPIVADAYSDPERGPARSRSPRRMTSMISRSPVGTLCRWSTLLPPTARWRSATIPISSPACRAARIW